MFLLTSVESTVSVKSPVCNSKDPSRCRWLAGGVGSAQSEEAVEGEPGLIPCEVRQQVSQPALTGRKK